MRVLSGRLKAVLVATLATIILVGSPRAVGTLANDPPGLARFMYAIGQVESHGDYSARNESSGAYGKYQIMPASWRAWAGRYLGDSEREAQPGEPGDRGRRQGRALYSGPRQPGAAWPTGG